MSQLDLKCDDIIEIFRDNLKAENRLMSVQSLFLSDRFAKKVDYHPYFQRNYVWDEEKASYFIESLLIGTEIPPIVLFQTKGKLEVIDGRQRYETLWRFLTDKFALNRKGLHCLTNFADKRYSELPQSVKDDFENTKLRVLQFSVVNEPILDDEKEDRIKKEIFRRYNSGIVPLNKEDIQRAAYITDSLTNALMEKLNTDDVLFGNVVDVLLPKSRQKKTKRDKITSLLYQIHDVFRRPIRRRLFEYEGLIRLDQSCPRGFIPPPFAGVPKAFFLLRLQQLNLLQFPDIFVQTQAPRPLS